uniref:Uncharacterized protein n=1 Tax=Anguilla anguilla TaxID=7936 RepID=A0A0E9Q450_ANGAN
MFPSLTAPLSTLSITQIENYFCFYQWPLIPLRTSGLFRQSFVR